MEQSPWFVLYNVFAWVLCYLVTRKYSRKELKEGNNKTQGNGRLFIYILFILSALFIFYGGDNARYEEDVKEYSTLANIDVEFLGGMELIYRYLAVFVSGNFLLWKLIVYGLGLLCVYITSLRLKNNNYLYLYSFAIFVLCSYGSSRAIVAVLVYLLGLSFIEKKKIIQSIFGIAIASTSIVLHSSMILPVAILPAILIKVTKTRFCVLMALLPVAVALINMLPDYLYGNADFIDSSAGVKFSNYTDGNLHGSGSSLLRQTHDVLNYFVVGILLYFAIKADNRKKLSSSLSVIVRASFFLAYVALVIGLSNIPGKWVLFYRYFEMIIPILFVVWPVLFVDNNLINKRTKIRYEYLVLMWDFVFLVKIVYHTIAA